MLDSFFLFFFPSTCVRLEKAAIWRVPFWNIRHICSAFKPGLIFCRIKYSKVLPWGGQSAVVVYRLRLCVFTLSAFRINLYHPEMASSVELNLIWDCFYGAMLECKVFEGQAPCGFVQIEFVRLWFDGVCATVVAVALGTTASSQSNVSVRQQPVNTPYCHRWTVVHNNALTSSKK